MIERIRLITAKYPLILKAFLLLAIIACFIVGLGVEWLIANYSAKFLVFVILGIPVMLIALLRTEFLIFLTALILMLASARISAIASPLALARWGPFFLFAFMVLWRVRSTKTLVRKLRIFDAVILLFIAYAFLSSAYSVNPRLTIFRAITLGLLYITVFWALWSYAQKVGEVKIVKALVFAVMVVIFISVLLAPFQPIFFQSDGRFRGVLQNPNTIGLLASLVFPLAIWRTANYRRWFDIIFVICLGGIFVLSGSRTSMASGLIGIAFLLYRKAKWGWIVTLGSSVTLFLMTAFAFFPQTWLNSSYLRLYSLFSGGARLQGWGAFLWMIRQRLFLGHGFGTEELLFGKYNIVLIEFQGTFSHNSYLGLTAQLGLLGVLLFFLPLIAFLLRRLTPRISSNAQLVNTSLVHALEAVLAVGLFACLLESWPYSVGNAFTFFFWTCVMLLVRLHLAANFEAKKIRPTGGRASPSMWLHFEN